MLSETIHIKQEYCNECGVAAYATITGLTLQRSRQLWGKLRNNKGWITHKDMKDMLIKSGHLDSGCTYTCSHIPENGNAIIYCRNKSTIKNNNSDWRHYVPYLNGKYYDPMVDSPTSKLDENLVPSIVYYLN